MRRGLDLLFLLFLAFAVPSIAAQTAAAGSESGATPASAPAKPGGAAASKPSWVVGLARLSIDGAGTSFANLQTALPLLILSELGELPPHYVSDSEASESAALRAERGKFGLGSELALRLDERAQRFFDPDIGAGQRLKNMAAADAALATSRAKLDAVLNPKTNGSPSTQLRNLPAVLWEGQGRGELLETASSLASILAQAKGLDLLVTGTIRDRSGYAEVGLVGYEPALAENVFAWTGYCSPEDPSPLAVAFVHKLEEFVAGRDFARIDFKPVPDSAAISVGDVDLAPGSRTLYLFAPGRVHLRFDAPGFVPAESVISVGMGDRKTVELKLEPARTGTVTIYATPPDAQLTLDSLPGGSPPLTAELNGSRIVAGASAPGFEPGTVVLPVAGQAEVHIDLHPADGLGPGGRMDRGKDGFYRSLGWLVLSIPVTALSAGVANGYAEGAVRTGDSQLYGNARNSEVVLGAASIATAALAVNAIVHLIIYLRSAR